MQVSVVERPWLLRLTQRFMRAALVRRFAALATLVRTRLPCMHSRRQDRILICPAHHVPAVTAALGVRHCPCTAH